MCVVSSETSMPCIAPSTLARAVKRQRQRERRRKGLNYDLAATPDSAADSNLCVAEATQPGCQCVDVDTDWHHRLAGVPVGLQLVVKKTFLELQCDDSMMDEYDVDADLAKVHADSWKILAKLQPSEFDTTDEIEDQRRAYRLLRASHVMSMLGMTGPPPRSLRHRTAQLGKEVALREVAYPLTSVVLHNRSICEGNDAEDRSSNSGSSSQTNARAAKRQRQRERTKFYKAC